MRLGVWDPELHLDYCRKQEVKVKRTLRKGDGNKEKKTESEEKQKDWKKEGCYASGKVCSTTTGVEWQADSAEPALLSPTRNKIQFDTFCKINKN